MSVTFCDTLVIVPDDRCPVDMLIYKQEIRLHNYQNIVQKELCEIDRAEEKQAMIDDLAPDFVDDFGNVFQYVNNTETFINTCVNVKQCRQLSKQRDVRFKAKGIVIKRRNR